MTWNARLCRECRERFVPLRADQQICAPCASQSDELHALLSYLRAHPEDPITRVSVATGLSEQTITQLAQAGLLVLIATPVVRVLASVVGFALEGDRLYAAITLAVLAILLVSLFGLR